MRFNIYTTLTILLVVALTVMAIAGVSAPWLLASSAFLLLTVALGYRSVIKPLRATQNGIYLIKSQDFGSRLSLTGQPDADRVISLFNTIMDTMKRERLKLQEQNYFLSQLVEVSPMGIAICDFDGNIISQNPAFTRFADSRLSAFMMDLEPGSTRTVRLGAGHIYRCSRLSFMDSGFKRPFLLVELLTDEIARAEKEIFNKIVRTIGHEVNNTLGCVTSLLETLADIHGHEPLIAGTIHSCHESCDNLVAFVKGYADLVKLPPAQPVLTDLTVMLRHLMPVLRTIAGHSVSLNLSIRNPHPVTVDTMLVERVVTNIVKNSVESIAGMNGGRIDIDFSGSTLTVTDNGHGISSANAQHLFTPFFSTKRPDRGLGLMLIADILHAHHAQFSLGTEPVTGLTRFTITFR